MIWADRVAIAAFALVVLILGLDFVTSDAPMREATYNARAARFAAACGSPAPDAPLSQNEAPVLGTDGTPILEDNQLPSSICDDEKLKEEHTLEAAQVKAPTVSDLVLRIGKIGLFFVAPLWAGLRLIDLKMDGPKRRLANNPYWRATRHTRRSRQYRRR